MSSRTGWIFGTALLLTVAMLGVRPAGGQEGREGYGKHDEYAKLIQVLLKSKHTLADGIQQALAKAPEIAISAKFELGDKGALSLSVYTAEKGLGVQAEKNVLKELAGSPEADAWKPEAEVFKDVEHVSRSAEQLTLMALSSHSLLEIVKKAEKEGTVFSITPVLRDRKPQFAVLVAAKDKVVELAYDLMSGEAVAKK